MLCCAGKLEVGQKDMEVALSGFSPASSWGVGRASAADGPGPRRWQDVGGLEDVREALQETLELPTRYAKLIAKCFNILLGHPTACQVTLLAMQLGFGGRKVLSWGRHAKSHPLQPAHLGLPSTTRLIDVAAAASATCYPCPSSPCRYPSASEVNLDHGPWNISWCPGC